MNELANMDSPRLLDLLTSETVSLGVQAKTWEEAVEFVGNLMLDADTIEPRYIQAMANVLEEMGGYAVLAPGIVLLHARPEDGALKPSFGLITLATPIPFGNAQNDPVDIVFAFGATDKESHVAALRDLAEILSNAETIAGIRSAKSVEDLLQRLRS